LGAYNRFFKKRQAFFLRLIRHFDSFSKQRHSTGVKNYHGIKEKDMQKENKHGWEVSNHHLKTARFLKWVQSACFKPQKEQIV
jgi:hypothetical protein